MVWLWVLVMFFKYTEVVIRKIVPIRTCKPWKPVDTKKVDPKDESEIEKGDWVYSKPCSVENRIPREIVISMAIFVILKLDLRIL